MNSCSRFVILCSKWRKLTIIMASLLVLYAIIGFLLLPPIVRSQAPKRLGALLGRPVSLERVRINPFALSITLDGFRIQDPDGQALLAWDRLYVNARISTVFTRRLSFSTIHLAHPSGRVVVEKGGRMNFSDIVERLSALPASPKPAQPEAPRPIRIESLEILGAQMQLVDRSLSEPFATTVGPLSIVLTDFRTEYDSRNPYRLAGRTESGETFSWQGRFSLEPLHSEGTFTLENLRLSKYQPYLRDQVAFELREGLLSVKADYRFQWTEGKHLAEIQHGALNLQQLALAEPRQKEAPLTLAGLSANGIQADLLENVIEIGALELQGGKLDLVRAKDGSINLAKLLQPKPQPKKEPGKPLHLLLRQLGLAGFSVDFKDLVPLRSVHTSIRNLSARIQDFTLDPAKPIRIALSADLDEGAKLAIEGTALPLKAMAELQVKLDGLKLAPFDPYLEPTLALRVNSGSLSLDGRTELDFQGRKSDGAAFKGGLRLANFEVMDAAQQEPFLRYRLMKLDGLDVSTIKHTLKLQSVDLVEPENRLVISKDGSTNVQRALKLVSEETKATAIPASVPTTPEDAYQLSIGKIRIQNGRNAFIDRSIEPNATLLLSNLNGTNTGLTTLPEGASSLDLKGLAGGIAPVLITGRAMPLRHDKDTDITVKISGADLTDFSPYAGKFLGYTVRKGKLDVEAHVRIQDRKLKIEDRLRLDQFFLGDKVDSPDATHLPVRLGLALLRDRKGLIEIEVPIDGSLDDPDFHYGKAVWNAVLNLLGKIATSPFTLISKLFGGGADLSQATFTAGLATLEPGEATKLESLAKALYERPELGLELESTVDAQDAGAIKRAKLEALLARVRSLSLGSAESPLPANERERWLRAAFEAAFPSPKIKDAKTPIQSAPASEMEQRLLAIQTVSEDELRTLAEARNQSVIAALTRSGQIEASRIFQVSGSEAAKAKGSKTYFTMK